MMTIGPFSISSVLKTYTKVMKSSPVKGDYDRGGPKVKDMVTISLEGKKKQVMEFATKEIIAKVKGTK